MTWDVDSTYLSVQAVKLRMGPAKWANKELLKLWEEFSDTRELTRRWPLLYNPLKRECLLFVGLNPSWKKWWLEGAWEKAQSQNTEFPRSGIRDPTRLFEWGESDPSPRKMEDIQDLDNVAVAREEDLYTYFKPMRKISHQIEMDDAWEHIDLFAVRERSQGDLMSLLKLGYDGHSDSVFANKQLKIATKLLEKLKPVVVVVGNALSSAILRASWKITDPDNWQEDETFRKLGHHEVQLNGRTVPVFFASMLGGQRALDRGSRERLAWQVWRVISHE